MSTCKRVLRKEKESKVLNNHKHMIKFTGIFHHFTNFEVLIAR